MTGSSPKAQDGTLTIMAGGSAEDFARAEPLLRIMGELVVHVGELGQGEMLKIINNSVAAANAATVGEALIVAQRTGVDLDALVQVMGKGSGGSAMLELKSRADARARLHDALQARAHAQGRAPVPRGGAGRRRAVRRRRRAPATCSSPRSPAATATTISPRSSRRSRGSPATRLEV